MGVNKMNINELPTLTYHFFEKPDKLFICDANFNTIIVTNFNCNDNFVLDAKSFDMYKKLGGDIKVNDNSITFNKYKCQNMDVQKPQLLENNVIYSGVYNSEDLKEATKFVGKQNFFQGVLLNDNGDIFATNSIKFYYKRKILPYTRFWNIPVQFINLLPKGQITLNFSDTKVWSEFDNCKIYSSIYNNKVPKIEQICDNFECKYSIKIDNNPELTYLPSNIVKIKIDNGIHFIFDDNEKSFVVDYDVPTDFVFECKISYENLISFLSDSMQIDFSDNLLRVNDKIIICYIN